ncbi:MAG: hypothetical protein RL329_2334 [Bacteroidota bacterium]
MMLQKKRLLNQSGWQIAWHQYLPTLKKRNYYVVKDVSIGGDAPKDFIKVYEYGQTYRANRPKWVAYIAKVGHKWYPVESITEYLMNRIGCVLGLDMAFSKLVIANEQIRFLSRYFLKKNEQLIHAAQIYAAFLNDKDGQFVETVEQQNLSRNLFTFQFAELSLQHSFPNNWHPLLENLVKLLIFDAIVGNSDRHFYNWGVISDIEGKALPRFTPIYDTARGLFWNEKEAKIQQVFQDKRRIDAFLKKYVQKSSPKTGWHDVENVNHFDLVKLLQENDTRFAAIYKNLLCIENLNRINTLLEKEFRPLLSQARYDLIQRCITLRFQLLLS